MKYEATLMISRHEFEELNRILNYPDMDCGSGEQVFTKYCEFENGYYVCVDVIADLKPTLYPAWSQAMLYDEDGVDVNCSQVMDYIAGDWFLWDNDDEYILHVNVAEE